VLLNVSLGVSMHKMLKQCVNSWEGQR